MHPLKVEKSKSSKTMILGRLDNQCFSLRTLIQQKPVWNLCFNWLRNMQKDLPLGQHDLDHKIVAAVYSERMVGNVETRLNESNHVAQIHYVVEGFEKISFFTTKKGLSNRSDDPLGKSDLSVNIVVTRSSGDFIVTLPNSNYRAVVSVAETTVLRKVLVSIPIQRIA